MNNKVFMLLVAGVLVLGGMVGGAFAGGVALGKSQEKAVARSSAGSPAQSQSSGQSPSNQEQLQQFRQQFQQQFQGGSAQGAQGMMGRGGLTGTIEKVEGNTITVNTPQGALQSTVGTETVIQRSVPGTLSDLKAGTRITVMGQRGEDGKVQAQTIMLVPAGTSDSPGGTFFPGGQRPRQE
ncbi:MAG: hypothetical protein HYY01_06880 [Chloroflexi bacterium]|nr:hypothetical protein [Chloroflexota bacterium]